MADPHGHASDPANDAASSRGPATREEWEELSANPDLREDLGYELLDLEAYDTDEDHVLFLPQDEDMLRDEAFIVVRKEQLLALGE